MTLKELAEYHDKQAVHFEPFGATNALTAFHRQAAECARSVDVILNSIPVHCAINAGVPRTEREEGWNEAMTWIIEEFGNIAP